MSTFRGLDGAVSLGGALQGSPLIQGAVAQGATSATIDGSPLTGVLLEGDTFTVAGDAQVYTVESGGAVGAVTANELTITFTPSVQVVGGWADNAAVTVPSNSMAEIVAWSLNTPRERLEDDVMRDPSKTYKPGRLDWNGLVEVRLDYGDSRQQEFVDAALASADTKVGLLLLVADGKQFWGVARATGLEVEAQDGTIVPGRFTFSPASKLALDWT